MGLETTIKGLESTSGSRDEKKASFGGEKMARKKDTKEKARQSSSCENDAREEEEGLVHSDRGSADAGAQKAEQEEEMHAADKDDDLEEGEIRSEDESDRKTKVNPVCSLYLKGSCIKSEKCTFEHRSDTKKGNYKMFDHPPVQTGTKSTVEGRNWSRLPQTSRYNSHEYFNESLYFLPSATVPPVDRFGRQLRSSTQYGEPSSDRDASIFPHHAAEEWNNPWSRRGPRHTSRPHSRSTSRTRSRSCTRSTSRTRSRSCTRSTSRTRSRPHTRSTSRTRSRPHTRSTSRTRSRSCSRSTSRTRSRSRSRPTRTRSRSRSRSTSRTRSRSRSRSTPRTRSRSCTRSTSRSMSRSRSRRRSWSRSSSRSQSPISPAYIRSVIRRLNSTFRPKSRSHTKSARSTHSYSGSGSSRSRSRSPSANRHLSRKFHQN